ncbi:MAG TPA: hypothetical protein PLX66_00365 [Bacilli bacterium]|nr:hypothetical protein [Bacilli bacterium]
MANLLLTCGTSLRIFYSIFLGLDSAVYWLVDVLYNVFITVCSVQLFSATTFEAFSTRIYAILGVVMLFVVASQLLMNIADPDKAASGEASTGKLVKNIIISLVAIVLLPTAFKYLYAIQNAVVTENIIGNLIVGGYASSTNTDFSTMVTNTGKDLEFKTFTAFINPVGYAGNNDAGCSAEKNTSLTYCLLLDDINDYGSSDYGQISKLNAEQVRKELDNELVEYRWGLSTITGLAVAYFLLSFSIDMGVRVAKLAYFQLIAPVPIIFRIIPKKQDVFDNWLKGLMGTYLGVFIRLMIIYFCIFLINIIPAAWQNIVASGGASDRTIVNAMVSILLVFGIFIFMKEAPKLISQMFGISDGDMSLGIGKKLAGAAVVGGLVAKGQAAGKKYAGKTWGGFTGALGGGWNSMVNGEGFGAGFRVGGLGGWDAGGWQGRNQANEMTRARFGNPKAEAALLWGGVSGGTKYRAKTSDKKKAAFAKSSYSRLEEAMDKYPGVDPVRKHYMEETRSEIWAKMDADPNVKAEFNAMSKSAKSSYFNNIVADKMATLGKQAVSEELTDRVAARETVKSYGGDFESFQKFGKVAKKEAGYATDIEKVKASKDARTLFENIMSDTGGTAKSSGASTPPPTGGTPGGDKK